MSKHLGVERCFFFSAEAVVFPIHFPGNSFILFVHASNNTAPEGEEKPPTVANPPAEGAGAKPLDVPTSPPNSTTTPPSAQTPEGGQQPAAGAVAGDEEAEDANGEQTF